MTEYHELAAELTLEDCLKDFKVMRKSIKKPMTDNAVKLLLIKLNKISKDELEQKAILLQSIDRCWQGVFPVKEFKDEPVDPFNGL